MYLFLSPTPKISPCTPGAPGNTGMRVVGIGASGTGTFGTGTYGAGKDGDGHYGFGNCCWSCSFDSGKC